MEVILNSRKLSQQINVIVKKIISTVKKNGDKAVIKYEKKFSKIKSKKANIIFTKNQSNFKKVDMRLKKSIDTAFKELKNFTQNKNFQHLSIKINLKTNLNIDIYLLKELAFTYQVELQVTQAQF